MSRHPSFSSSSTSSLSSPQFDSGIQQSVNRFSGSTESKGTGWEIRYNELRFGNLLGQGTYGKVYTGTYHEIKVAIKVYNIPGTLPTEQRPEVLKEAGLMARLPQSSPYLIGFYGVSFDQNYCLVMEYAEGGTLEARLKETTRGLALPQQMRWAMQISHGLNQLHSLNILHRDLKSKNILLNGREEAKVGDFGLSIIKSTSVGQSKTSSAMGTAGTLPWMAPELHNGESNSKKTDVYSLGIVLWEIVSRKMPYAGLMVGQMISMTVQGKRDPLPTLCPEIFRVMITACCHLEAKQRPTAEHVVYQFETALRSLEGLSPSLSSSRSDLKYVRSSIKNLDISKKLDSIYGGEKKEIQQNPPRMSSSGQTLMPPLKQLSADQLKLQNQLIVACKQGDEKVVNALLRQGAKPDIANEKGEKPLGAGVWGMCPSVVSALLNPVYGVASMIWEECEKHNFKYYQEVFIVSKFEPKTYGEWSDLLLTISSNSFLRNLHLKKINIPLNVLWKGAFDRKDLSEWERLDRYVKSSATFQSLFTDLSNMKRDREWCRVTEQSFLEYRIQIKQLVGAQKNPIEAKKELASLKLAQSQQILMPVPKSLVSADQLKLQNKLIEACKQGDEKGVKELLIQGAKSNIPDDKGEQPLGAAVWGMCPNVVNALLQQTNGIAPMTWEECEKHNLEYYKNVFIVPKIEKYSTTDWSDLLRKVDVNLFLRTLLLQIANERQNKNFNWDSFKREIEGYPYFAQRNLDYDHTYNSVLRATERRYAGFKVLIKQEIETAVRSTITTGLV